MLALRMRDVTKSEKIRQAHVRLHWKIELVNSDQHVQPIFGRCFCFGCLKLDFISFFFVCLWIGSRLWVLMLMIPSWSSCIENYCSALELQKKTKKKSLFCYLFSHNNCIKFELLDVSWFVFSATTFNLNKFLKAQHHQIHVNFNVFGHILSLNR